MTFAVTPVLAVPDDRRTGRLAGLLLRRLLVVAGGMVAFGIFAIVLASHASAQTAHRTSPSPVDDLSTVQSTPSLVERVATVTAPLVPTVHAVITSVAPVVNPVLTGVTTAVEPVTAPVLEPVAAVLAPPLRAVSTLTAPVVAPILGAAAPVLRPVTADLGLAPVASALGVPDAAVVAVSAAPDPARSDKAAAGGSVSAAPVQIGSLSTAGTPPKTVVRQGDSVDDGGSRLVSSGFFATWSPGHLPGPPVPSPVLGASASTSSAGSGFGGGHGPGVGISDGAFAMFRQAAGKLCGATGVLSPQPGYVHGRDHPS